MLRAAFLSFLFSLVFNVSGWGANANIDALIDTLTLDGKYPKKPKSRTLSDPFQIQFFAASQQENLSFEVRTWIQRFLAEDYEGTAHLWSSIEQKMPPTFEESARGAYLYSLWKLHLDQTFLNEWMSFLAKESFLKSPSAAALEMSLDRDFDSWILKTAPRLQPETQSVLTNIPVERGGVFLTLKAWALLRQGKSAQDILKRLSEANRLRPLLAKSVALQLVREGNLVEAGKTLRDYGGTSHHPSELVKTQKESEVRYELELARILYQGGALSQAEEFYERIPNGSEAYLEARDELMWTWLLLGKMEKLRGAAVTLNSKLFEDRFSPESFIVNAISHLKLCYYGKTAQTLKDFIQVHERWAKRIDQAIASGDSVKPSKPDFYSYLAERALAERERESKQVEELAARSIKASLPAIGVQAHWVRANKLLQHDRETAKKEVANEYRRIWKNQQAQLKEAIRKMRHVKVELLTQVRRLAEFEKLATSKVEMTAKLSNEEAQVYPFDGVLWPDELFSLEALSETKCLKKESL